MGAVKAYLMEISEQLGDGGDITQRTEWCASMADAADALWDTLGHLSENDLPPDVWNEAVGAIDELRYRLDAVGLRSLCNGMANFKYVDGDDNPDEDRPLRPDVMLSTGKTISHTRDPNGSQVARPAMTPDESGEYEARFKVQLYEIGADCESYHELCGRCADSVAEEWDIEPIGDEDTGRCDRCGVRNRAS